MILKTISVVLPEKMIQEIDEMLLEKNFASRSDFFRHLVRMWQLQEGQENPTKEMGKELEEKAKLLN